MKIQNLTIIFILIILPISLVLSIYIQNQIKTLNYQIAYDSKLYTATYDAIKAFQLNTINSSTSDLVNSKIRDIQASVNTFFNSIESNFNLNGYTKEAIQEYVPAVVYTMYDGYYIYSPYENVAVIDETDKELSIKINSDNTQYGLKPYVYYSKRYVGTGYDLVINYSLDNYITVRGVLGNEYINKSGYIIDYNNVTVSNVNIDTYTTNTDVSTWKVIYRGNEIIKEDNLYEVVGNNSYKYAKINGIKYYLDDTGKVFSLLNGVRLDETGTTADNYRNIINNNCSGKRYYIEGAIFSKWIANNLKDKIDKVFEQIDVPKNTYKNTVVDKNSNFNMERFEVIKNSIETNLSTAIASYNKYYKTGANFQMPKLKETEWELVLNNVCVISFLQGLSIGGKLYNGYSVIPNNKTKEVVAENSIYITADDDYYQVMDTELLNKNISTGYFNLDFEVASINNGDEVAYYLPKADLGSYTSIVRKSGISSNWDGNVYEYLIDPNNDGNTSDEETKLAKTYYTALGRERYGKLINTYQTSINIVPVAKDTKYKIEYYKENEQKNGYNLFETVEKTGKEGDTVTATVKNYTGFRFDETIAGTVKKGTLGNIDNELVLKLYYTRYEYEINYILNGGTNPSDAPKTYRYGVGAKLKNPTKNGSTFEGWYTNGIKISEISKTETGDITLEARWKEPEVIPPTVPTNPENTGIYAKLYTYKNGTDGYVLELSSNKDYIDTQYELYEDYGDIEGGKKIPWNNGEANLKEVKIIDKIYPISTASWFYKCSELEKIHNINNINTSNVTNMEWMFYGCGSLTELNLSSFDTSNVTNIERMFMSCENLTELDVSSFNTSDVTNMEWMFYGCGSLTELNLSSFDTSKVTDMSRMFDWCKSLTELDVSSFDTSKVTDMSYMFCGCSSLTELDVSSFNTSNVTDTSWMFYNCKNLTELDVSSFDTSNVTDMERMFMSCENLTELDVSSFNTSDVTDMNAMFYDCKSLTELNVSSFDTSNVTYMHAMFYGCSSSTELDVSSFDTSKVTDMHAMFHGCSSLTELDVSLFDTSKVTDMYAMFISCKSLKELDVSSFDTSKVESMSYMFGGCSNLTELDVSSFDTSKVTNMYAMFISCKSLKKLDVSSFDTSNVTYMDNMYNGCANLTELDLSSFDTSKVTDMSVMFGDCESLKAIYVGNGWTTKNANTYAMFLDCGVNKVTKK